MAYYRLYFLDHSNHIEHFREFEASNDLEASTQSDEWRGVQAMELWSGSRKVTSWKRLGSSPEAIARTALRVVRRVAR